MSTNELWHPSGIDYTRAMAEFPASAAISREEYDARLQICRTCSLCRLGKCLPITSCVRRLARVELSKCPKGLWPKE